MKTIPLLLVLGLSGMPFPPATSVAAAEPVPMARGHHGGMVTQCTDPVFSNESPGREARVKTLESFNFTASDNTVPESIQVLVNLQPVDITVTRERSQRLYVEARLRQPVTQGRAWIKVTGQSDDGCDQIHAWNVHAGE